MKSELKRKWVEALRGGEYLQTDGTLYDPDRGGYCCLGVLLSVALGRTEDDIRDEQYIPNEGGDQLSDEGRDLLVLPKHLHDALIKMNDSGKSFSEIADYIERHVPCDPTPNGEPR